MGMIITAAVVAVVVIILAIFAGWILIPALNACAGYAMNWLSIPVVNQVILWGSACSVVAATAILVARGIRNGLFGADSNRRFSLGEYLFKSIATILIVAMVPTICSLVMTFGTQMMKDISGVVPIDTASGSTTFFIAGGQTLTTDEGSVDWNVIADNIMSGGVGILIGMVVGLILRIAILIFAMRVMYQIFKREWEMLIISVVAPWVAIKSATEAESNEVGELVLQMVGMCIVQWVQYLFLMIALGMFNVFMGASLFSAITLTAEGWVQIMLMFACCGAALGAPQLLDRWTFIGSGGNGQASTMVMRSTVGILAQTGRAAGKAITKTP